MAINLKKEYYQSDDRNSETDGDIRRVYPDDPNVNEIYPKNDPAPPREIYPQGSNQPQERRQQPAAPNITPETRYIQTANEQYPGAPVYNGVINPGPPKKKMAGWKKLLLILASGGLLCFIALFCIGVFVGIHDAMDTETSTIVAEENADNGIYDSGGKTVYHDYRASEITAINITDCYSDITITGSDNSNYISLNAEETEDHYYDISTENGVLTVTAPTHDSEGDLYLYIPENYEGTITVTSSGEADISCFTGGNITLTSESGSVTLSDMVRGSAKVDLAYGDIYTYNLNIDSCDIKTSCGYITMNNASISKNAELFTGSGAIDISNTVTFDSTDIHTDNGRVSVYSSVFNGDTSVECSNDYMSLTDIIFRNLSLKNVNGSIDLTSELKASNYTVTSQIINGEINIEPRVGETHGEYTLDVNVTNGNADLYFAE